MPHGARWPGPCASLSNFVVPAQKTVDGVETLRQDATVACVSNARSTQ